MTCWKYFAYCVLCKMNLAWLPNENGCSFPNIQTLIVYVIHGVAIKGTAYSGCNKVYMGFDIHRRLKSCCRSLLNEIGAMLTSHKGLLIKSARTHIKPSTSTKLIFKIIIIISFGRLKKKDLR